MILIHARLRGPTDAPIPADAASRIATVARGDERLEHVAVHTPTAGGGAVVGLFFTAESRARAECSARRICARATDGRDLLLRDYTLESVSAVAVSGTANVPGRPGNENGPGWANA